MVKRKRTTATTTNIDGIPYSLFSETNDALKAHNLATPNGVVLRGIKKGKDVFTVWHKR